MKYVYDANLGFLFNDTVDYKVVPDRIFVVALEPKQATLRRLRRHPCRRATNYATICSCERIGQTASVCKTRWDVAVERRTATELVADMRLRIEDDYGLSCRISYYAECGREIGIARNKHKRISLVLIGILQHFRCHIDICQLFGNSCTTNIALAFDENTALAGVLRSFKAFYSHSVVALNHRYALARQRINVFILSGCSMLIATGVNYSRCEILNRFDLVFGDEKLSR